MNAKPQTCRTPSPLGEILLVANARGDALRGLYLEGQKYFPQDAARWTASPRLPLFRNAVAQLGEYFAGRRENFALALEPAGTEFQRTVWREIARVPYGGTISYAELARRCGRPSAVRAAGAATGRNPITVVIPCHRIVGSGGALTGYAGGLDRKRALLAIEAGSGRAAR
ncbi:MAG TPA: methylated-DNA--[protein]-cysteine S-methyltransferase [Casimicrobiaceae bacterium]|nr:methylated-DNA--[protein]-cysteine S-methyltransferase [Casimicrobiaceae bacterium]